MKKLSALVAVMALSSVAHSEQPAKAGVSASDLTPMGAVKAGNASGEIPVWEGAAKAFVPGWQYGKFRGDYWKYKDDKKITTIDASNYEKYADKLSPGQLELFKQIKGYSMEIYPSRRTCDAPSIVKENTEKNASFAKMSSEGWYLAEAYLPGVPFPAPKTGAEVMTNGKYRYQGVGVEFPKTFTTVSPRKGTSEFIKVDAYMVSYTPWGVKSANQLSKLPPVEFYANFGYNAPPALAGMALNMTTRVNQPGSEVFYYFPGQRRVRRMPSYSYDSPQIGFENQYTMDEPTMFWGAMDRFEWKLVGKKELFIPYNSFGAYDFNAKFEDVAKKDYMNPSHRRYELQRVWVVEATVKSGMRHAAPKRTYYLDEDSWNYVMAEDYDSQGKMWKVRESYVIPVAELEGACHSPVLMQYNLADGRYVLDMHAIGTGVDIKWHSDDKDHRLKPNFYTSESLRSRSER
ncbi:MAG: DUF1329 domain-containing protein [Methyloversatilis sp.]|uniref:DUF1329 domain-containing protein n=1 Tax=Methyloversatilis sp. TaxID=2569862 RepID=UPI0025DDAF1F|nr:DUF1329 domain-containing protein [Methyloversatilis sp.]MCR6664870.1 DUF1329 domain-containing protein [Methyloversatilis sp.]